jgi:hypothetical protein
MATVAGRLKADDVLDSRNTGIVGSSPALVTDVQGRIQKFPDWPPGARTANGTALCHIL